jgi:hypothetical protein
MDSVAIVSLCGTPIRCCWVLTEELWVSVIIVDL